MSLAREQQVMRKLHPDWILAERKSALISNGIWLLAVLVMLSVPSLLDWFRVPVWIWIIAILVVVLRMGMNAFVLPYFRYEKFAFNVSDEEVHIHRGWLFISEMIVPMTRVQHVELESGPILRQYGLASVEIVTAATTHVIAGLKLDEAEQLKQRIGELARRTDE
ncbi:PH domain-containing protein [Paenibacillus sp. WLX2291]|uniref:PH domain-containing protein n=1 Tax=Paenibacillus sp. WLX2291 TaxID=3296934 RepID=UPI003983E41E